MTIQDIADADNFVVSNPERTIIKVIGVGGGGNNAINHMYNQGIKNVSFVICNTDLQALNHSPVPTRLLIGPNTTHGLGAGNDPAKARDAAEESVDDINSLFDDDTKMVFITAGMGGGTGTGAAPVVARVAKERGLLTIGIVTIPFLFERERKILKALDGADEMSKYVDALLVINNERLTEIYKDLDFLNAFHKADETLTTAARSISELITCKGHINLDFNDVDATLRNGGAAIISTGYGEGEHRVTMAIEDALNSPLLKDRDIFSSKRFLFNIYYDPNAEKPFKMAEADELTSFMSNLDPGVDAIWGVAFDETLGNKVKISILAAGFDVTIHDNEKGRRTYTPGKHTETPQQTYTNPGSRLASEYGAEKIGEMQRNNDRQRYIVLTPEQMDDDSILERIESTPVYKRDKKTTEEIRASLSRPAAQPATTPSNPPSNPLAGNVISFTGND